MAADLAENVDDLICTFDTFGGGNDPTMDTLAMFVFGWLLAAMFVLWLGRHIYNRYYGNRRTTMTVLNQQQATATSSVAALATTDAAAAVVGGGGGGASQLNRLAGSKSKGYVPPTPPVRKRIARQSPAPELNRRSNQQHQQQSMMMAVAPPCTGADQTSTKWTNDLLSWIYHDRAVADELTKAWIGNLNEYAKKAATEQGINVEFVRILAETNPPILSNLFCECDSKDDVTLTCDVEAYPAFQLKCTRQMADKLDASHYRVNVNKFRARLNAYCVTEKLRAEVKFDGWPEIKVAIAPVGNIKNNLDETQLQELITEIVINSFRNTDLHLNLGQYQGCPRLTRQPVNQNNYYYQQQQQHLMTSPMTTKRLLVKVIRATGLGKHGGGGCKRPYCVIEMDEPPQRNQTAIGRQQQSMATTTTPSTTTMMDVDSPIWDEHFLFDLSPNTAEILFEIYDQQQDNNKRFLGLGIVGVDELTIEPSQRQIITLQSRPYESDAVSGTITVEFLFIEGADVPNLGDVAGQPYKIKESIRSGGVTTQPLSLSPQQQQQQYQHQQQLAANGNKGNLYGYDRLTNGDHHYNSNVSNNNSNYLMANNNNSSQYFGNNVNRKGVTPVIQNLQRQPSQRLVKPDYYYSTGGGGGGVVQQPLSLPGDGEFRGRPRKRRDFFGTIRRRLGKSKMARSKSAGPDGIDGGGGAMMMGRDDSMNRSISADRARGEDGYRLLNVPREETSRRSSLSEASGLSSASTRTYLNEASTLVLETIENGIKKHYLVPLSLAQKSKWRKKGAKLHIFNDHTFVAKHLSGSTVCQVCSKSIARRIGKQGYECRDCLLKCHKQCHVKVNDNCPTSTIHNIELSYIGNPYTDKNIRML